VKLIITQKAQKDLGKLDKHTRQKIRKALDDMVEDISTADLKKLRGTNFWRLRVGDYRALLYFSSGWTEVLVHRVMHRKDAYR